MKRTYAASCMIMAVFCMAASVNALEFSEIMYNPEGADDGHEWIEIYASEESNISSTRLVENGVSHQLQAYQGDVLLVAGEHAIIADDPEIFLEDYPSYHGTLIDSSYSLSNSGEELRLEDSGFLDSVNYTNEYGNGNGKTIEKVQGEWIESIVLGGTPGYGEDPQVPEFGLLAGIGAAAVSLLGFMRLRQTI